MLGSLLSSVAPYILAVALAASSAWYLTHKMDSAAYEALQLADSQAVIQQIDANNAAADAARAKQAKVEADVRSKLRRLDDARNASEKKLTAALNMEGMANATLRACLDMRLPDSVLRTLAR